MAPDSEATSRPTSEGKEPLSDPLETARLAEAAGEGPGNDLTEPDNAPATPPSTPGEPAAGDHPESATVEDAHPVTEEVSVEPVAPSDPWHTPDYDYHSGDAVPHNGHESPAAVDDGGHYGPPAIPPTRGRGRPPEPEDVPDEEDGGGAVKSFLEHLEDLRWTLIKSGSAALVGIVICLLCGNRLTALLKVPLIRAGPTVPELINIDPAGAFYVAFQLAIIGGIILASPFIFYFVLEFVLPALKMKEKKYFFRGLFVGGMLFFTGVFFCYWFLMPVALKASVQYADWLGITSPGWQATQYFGFVTKFMLGMGLGFELPVVILILVKLNILNYSMLAKGRRYMIVINLVLGAVLTTPEIVTQVLMALPLQLLYEATIWIAWYWERQEKKRELAASGG